MVIRLALALGLCAQVHAQHWFTAPRWYDPSLGQMRAAADLDLDGDVDVVRFAGNTATTLLNTGAGEFAPGPTTALPAGWDRPELLIDLDNDGKRDLVLAATASYASGHGLLVFPGTGAGGFGAPTFLALVGEPAALAQGEINGDGVPDLAILYLTPAPARIPWAGWMLGSTSGNHQLQPPLQLNATAQYVQDVATFDPDGNGVDDLAVVVDNNLLRVLPTVGTSPTLGPSFPLNGSSSCVLATDVDGDLDDDLVACGLLGDNGVLTVIKTLPGAAFAPSSQTFFQFGSLSFLAGDLDGDGDPDLLGRAWNGGFLTFENVNAGVFAARWRQPYMQLQYPLGLLGGDLQDLDGDGKLDCVDLNTIFFGSGTLADPSGSPAEGAVGLVDMDGDGDLDVLQPFSIVQRNNGRAEFTAVGHAMPTPLFGDAIVAADFDGDGLQEMLVPRSQQGGWVPTFFAWHRVEDDGNGNFVDRGQATPTGANFNPLLIDSNHDGVLDLIDTQGHGLLANNGQHTWSVLGGALPGFYPRAVADLDGDGDDDCVGFQLPMTLVVMHQTGPHSFAPAVIAAMPGAGYASALGDLDDDGDLDVVVAPGTGWPAFTLSTFLNQGGTFVPGPVISGTFGDGEAASRLLVGDVDGDGNTDLACSHFGVLTVWRRSGPGLTYDPRRSFVMKDARHFADIDQDGDLDVTGAYGALNVRHDGPTAGFQRQYGTAALGFGARRPTCSSVGIVRANHTPVLRLANALGGSVALLGLGTGETNLTVPTLPGLVFYTQPAVQLAVALSGAPLTAGAGRFDLPLALPPGLAGATFFLQGYVLDPAAPSLFTHSNGLELHIGN